MPQSQKDSQILAVIVAVTVIAIIYFTLFRKNNSTPPGGITPPPGNTPPGNGTPTPPPDLPEPPIVSPPGTIMPAPPDTGIPDGDFIQLLVSRSNSYYLSIYFYDHNINNFTTAYSSTPILRSQMIIWQQSGAINHNQAVSVIAQAVAAGFIT